MTGPASAGGPPALPDHPDLPLKPPLVFLAAIAVGYLIDHYAPMGVRPAGYGAAGMVVCGVAVCLAFWSALTFRAAETPPEPWKPTRTIVERGPFAFSRNPIYIAFALLQVGIGLWSDRLAVVLMVIPALLVTDVVIVRREERYLERKFGDEYRGYRSRVRRWI